MWCTICEQHLSECKCPDIEERLARLATLLAPVAMKWCRTCDKHHDRCTCVEPDFYVRTGRAYGRDVPANS